MSKALIQSGAQFTAALTFLTRLRLPIGSVNVAISPMQGAWSFPIVGALVGGIAGLVGLVAGITTLPSFGIGLLLVAATALLTGALHEDGLADTVDGFGGGVTRQRKLEIMRDSHIGSFGVLALVISTGLRATSIGALNELGHPQLLGGLVAAHASARAVLPGLMWLLPPARTDGLAVRAGRPPARYVVAAMLFAIVISVSGLGVPGGIASVAVAGGVAIIMAMIARRQIQGYTGDVLGATEQIAEIAVLLVALWVP
jgi:adenosylcobinamide-GDP ribazoletransferase